MADVNDWAPGDDTNVILRKILTRLAGLPSAMDGGLTDAELRASPIPVTVSGGGAVTIADGADVTQGAKADAAITNPASSATEIALLKGLLTRFDVAASTLATQATLADNKTVGGISTSIKDTTAVSASPDYSIGDAVGGKRTLASAVRVSGGTAILEDIMLLDRANQGPGLEILFFDADPTAATITDNSGFVFSTDDLKLIARVSVGVSDWTSVNSKKYAHIKSIGALLKAASGTSLYVAIVATTAYNAAATDDMQVIYKFLQD
jgi:hypothetical protein